ncbi:MAG: phospholipase D-like domain-containing protein [Candidatus Pacearchaeota archaeon]
MRENFFKETFQKKLKDFLERNDTIQKSNFSIEKEKIEENKERNFVKVNEGIYTGRPCYSLFKDFILKTEESLDISTNVFSNKTLFEIIKLLKKNVKIRIVSARQKDKDYNFKEDLINLEVYRLPRNHSKFIIRDKKALLIGSANLEESSLLNFFETNYITFNKEIVESATEIFESIISGVDLRKKKNSFLFSGNEKEDLPKILFELIRKEEEISIILGLSLFQKEVLDYILSTNPQLKVKIILGGDWPKNIFSPVDKETVKYINNYKKTENIEIEFKKEPIHSKVYFFKKNRKRIISSMNMTRDSFGRLYESGIIIEKEEEIKKFFDIINSLEKKGIPSSSYFDFYNDVYTPKEEITDSSSVLNLPWKTAYEDETWPFSRYNIEKKEKVVIEKNKEETEDKKIIYKGSFDSFVGGRYGKTLIKSLYGHSTKTSSPKITKGHIHIKSYDRKKDIKSLERKKEIIDDEEEKKKIEESIEWLKKELKEKYNL